MNPTSTLEVSKKDIPNTVSASVYIYVYVYVGGVLHIPTSLFYLSIQLTFTLLLRVFYM